MGGIPGQEDPGVAVVVDDPMADAEDRGPAEVGGPRRLRRQAVEDGLDVAQLRGPSSLQSVSHLALAWRLRRQLRRNQHRHPVAISSWQRYADKHVVDLPVRLVDGPDREADGQGPVDFDVSEHVLLGEGIAGELDA